MSDQYTDWVTIITNNVPLVLILFTVLFASLVKLSLMVWNQRSDIEKSNVTLLIEKIDTLVEKIDALFSKHDNHEVRIDSLENRVGNHFSLCKEREKLLADIKTRQDYHIEKFNLALVDRANEVKREDRTDRES